MRCECRALPDGVRIDMSTFKRSSRSSKRLRGQRGKSCSDDESSDDDDEDDEDDGDSTDGGSSESSSDEVDIVEEESCGSRRSARWEGTSPHRLMLFLVRVIGLWAWGLLVHTVSCRYWSWPWSCGHRVTGLMERGCWESEASSNSKVGEEEVSCGSRLSARWV